MERVDGTFYPATDHSFSTHHEDNRILGGFVTCAYLGNSMNVHMAAQDPHWFSRELAWLVFDYCFNQCGCHKMITGVRSDNPKALVICMRAGWQIETTITDLFAEGVDMMVLWMRPETCPWLRYQPRLFRSTIMAPVA